MTFDHTPFSYTDQYIWYQFLYQGGIFISRTSIFWFQIPWLMIIALLQVINLVFLIFEAYFQFLPFIYIVFIIIFYEGLVGGLSYANTIYRIRQKTNEKQREFAMLLAGTGDSTGIVLAGIFSIFLNRFLCEHRGNCKKLS
jgi:battenin